MREPDPLNVHSLSSPERPFRIHLLRVVLENHVKFSEMADNKANIVIGTSAVIFSLLLPQIQANGAALHILALLITAAMAAFIGILAVTPRTRYWFNLLFGRSRRRKKPQSFNPLFFAAYVHLSEEEYVDYMFENVLPNESDTCEALLVDLHRLGLILERKYRYVNYSYAIFALGLVL